MRKGGRVLEKRLSEKAVVLIVKSLCQDIGLSGGESVPEELGEVFGVERGEWLHARNCFRNTHELSSQSAFY